MAKKQTAAEVKSLEELKTLDDIKQELLESYKINKILYQKDVADAIEHLDLSDQDSDELFDWFNQNKIVITDDEDLNITDADLALDDDSMDFDADDEVDDFTDEEIWQVILSLWNSLSLTLHIRRSMIRLRCI